MTERREVVEDAAVLLLWQKHRITYRPIVQIVAEMALDRSLRCAEALEDWATADAVQTPHCCWPASRWRSEICYRLLKAGVEAPGGLDAWFEARAREVREFADRVSD